MPGNDGSPDAIARKARRVADRIEALPDAMVKFLEADPKPSRTELRETLNPTEISIECLEINQFIERHWTPAHAETFRGRIDNVVDGARVFIEALAVLTAPQSSMRFDRFELGKFGGVALITAQYVRRWAEDIGRKARPKTPKESKSRKKARRRRKTEPTVRMMEAHTLRKGGCAYRRIGETLGISHETARQWVQQAEVFLNPKSRSVRTRRLPTNHRGQADVADDT